MKDRNEYLVEWRAANREKIRLANAKYRQKHKERLNTAARERAREQYHGDLDRAREVTREQSRKWRAANPGKHRAAARQYRVDNAAAIKQRVRKKRSENRQVENERIKRWKKANPGKVSASAKKYALSHSEQIRLKSARRRAQKLNAVPSWADNDAIKKIYKKAKQLGLTVDHIIPLQGKNVCGLHVEYNLQLLTHAENVSKGNRVKDS